MSSRMSWVCTHSFWVFIWKRVWGKKPFLEDSNHFTQKCSWQNMFAAEKNLKRNFWKLLILLSGKTETSLGKFMVSYTGTLYCIVVLHCCSFHVVSVVKRNLLNSWGSPILLALFLLLRFLLRFKCKSSEVHFHYILKEKIAFLLVKVENDKVRPNTQLPFQCWGKSFCNGRECDLGLFLDFIQVFFRMPRNFMLVVICGGVLKKIQFWKFGLSLCATQETLAACCVSRTLRWQFLLVFLNFYVIENAVSSCPLIPVHRRLIYWCLANGWTAMCSPFALSFSAYATQPFCLQGNWSSHFL